MPLSAQLYAAIARETSAERRRTSQRVRELRSLPQTFWSIPEKLLKKKKKKKKKKGEGKSRRVMTGAQEGQIEGDDDDSDGDDDSNGEEEEEEEEEEVNCWAPAVAALNAIPAATLPSDKMDLLLHAVRQIEIGGTGGPDSEDEDGGDRSANNGDGEDDDEHDDGDKEKGENEAGDNADNDGEDGSSGRGSAERRLSSSSSKSSKSVQLLGADDLFPVFVYVLSQADKLWVGGGVVVLRELLQNLANPERQRWSASAYYSATLEAAISHIANIARTRGRGGAVR